LRESGRGAVARENGYAILGTPALPGRFIAEFAEAALAASWLVRLELREANYVWLGPFKPSHKVHQSLVDAIDVKRGNAPTARFWEPRW
jgi:hypothetical protein